VTLDWAEAAARLFEQATGPRWATPGELARHITPGTQQTPALDLIDDALVRVANTPDGRLIITMPPQEGKSTRVAGDFPTWWLTQDAGARIVVASYAQGLATRNGRAIRNRVTSNPNLGLTIAPDNGAVHEWTLAGHQGGVLSVGIGGGLTGRPADLLIIDDPIKDRADADSQTFRDRVWDWWTDVASTRLAPGAPVVVILTRWHEDDLAGRLLAAEDGHLWHVLNIPAQADHRPELGETDALGREVGEYLDSARGRTEQQWAAIKVRSGARTWASLFQGRPAPAEGALFKRDAWEPRYTETLAVERIDGSKWVPVSPGDQLAASWDLAFKGTTSSDYVVGQVWLRRGVHLYLLDMVRRRMTFTETLTEVKRLAARWPQAVLKLVEDKANGPAVIDMLSRSVPGLIPVEPEGGKIARANSATPFVEAGNVHLPTAAILPNVEELVEEAAAFPNGAHDDAVDAMTQAINRLLLNPLLLEDEAAEPNWDDVDDEMAISRY
jgi:predicted phage terminase large subunit-like protein